MTMTDPGTTERVPAPLSPPDDDAPTSETTGPGAWGRMPALMWPVVIVAALGGTTTAVVGFALSYGTLVEAAQTWGFGPVGSQVFPLGIDGAILAFYAWALVLIYRRMPKPLLMWAAHLMTVVTVLLNVDAAARDLPSAPSAWDVLADQPGRLLSHGSMPIVFVFIVEGLRHYIVRTARLESGAGTLELSAWVLNFRETWRVFRTARIWDLPYDVVREQRRTLAIHRVWHDHREAIESQAVSPAVLAELLAPHGVSVEDALALPDQMRRAEKKREAEGERERRRLEHDAELERLHTEAETLRATAEVDVLRAEVEGEREAATHRARAAAETAAVEASAATREAQRAATEAERRADDEEDEAAAIEREAKNKQLRRQAAQDEAAAIAAEDVAGLGERERNVRRVARMILVEGGGDPNRVPLGAIETRLGVANGTASTYRNAAIGLISEGYDHRQDPLHAADAAVRR
ncbi:hypothetical protein ADL27_56940 [Streptomyces sp. NRRL F-6602]|nr:hypothetical protein ADL27_56940 [Streptomyces sp. NRRL F-6602]